MPPDLWRNVFERMPDACYVFDAQGLILAANHSAETLAGYSFQEIAGKNLFSLGLFDPTGLRLVRAHLDLADPVAAGPVRVKLYSKDGSPGDVDFWICPIRTAKETLFLQTARKLAPEGPVDARLRAAEERAQMLLERAKAVGLLASGVAHGFNNIIAVILMNLGLLRSAPNLQPEVKDLLMELEGEATRAMALSRQLLIFNRPLHWQAV